MNRWPRLRARYLVVCGAVWVGAHSAHAATVSWKTASDGAWGDSTKWSVTQSQITGNDYVIAATGADYRVTLALSGYELAINSLRVDSPNATLVHEAPRLTAVGGLHVEAGTYHLAGGTLFNTTVSAGPGGVFRVSSGNLQDVTFSTPLIVQGILTAGTIINNAPIDARNSTLFLYSGLAGEGAVYASNSRIISSFTRVSDFARYHLDASTLELAGGLDGEGTVIDRNVLPPNVVWGNVTQISNATLTSATPIHFRRFDQFGRPSQTSIEFVNATLDADIILENAVLSTRGPFSMPEDIDITIKTTLPGWSGRAVALLRGDMTLAKGELTFDRSPDNQAVERNFQIADGSLTIGPDYVVRNLRGSAAIMYSGATQGTTINYGLISAEAVDGGYLSVHQLDNRGIVEVRNGGALNSNARNYSNGKLTGGTWRVFDHSEIRLNSPVEVTTNAADVTLAGVDSLFSNLDKLRNNEGRLAILDDRDFAAVGDFVNAGRLEIGIDSVFDVVNGAFSQGEQARLAVHIDGSDGEGLLRGNAAVLDGVLELIVAPDYSPTYGQTHDLVTYSSRVGSFDEFIAPPLPGELTWEVVYTPTSVAVRVVPEPSFLLLAGLPLLAFRRARRAATR